ncbi:MAG: glutamate--tRNA ligase [Pseudomonadota bacterium]
MKTRFAPSPTGLLHVGNARTALIAWLWARAQGGVFVLRIDDTDTARSQTKFIKALQEDLRWLGLDWDSKVHQSARLTHYRTVIDGLIARDRVYPCYESADELALLRRAQQAQGKPPRYHRDSMSAQERAARARAGARPHYRFALSPEPVVWQDLILGEVSFGGHELSDPVIMREDQSFTYHLCSVIDDVDMAMSTVIRGVDHLANTAAHIQMIQALEGPPITFAHLPLIVGADSRPLSKREEDVSLAGLRELGIEALALAHLLAFPGGLAHAELMPDTAAMAERFELSAWGRSPQHFRLEDLHLLNGRVLSQRPFRAVRETLMMLIPGADPIRLEALWDIARENIQTQQDMIGWWQIIEHDELPLQGLADVPPGIGADFLAAAIELLPPEPWDEKVLKAWIRAVGERTGQKGKSLFGTLRVCLTGRPDGPNLTTLLSLMGRARTHARLAACAR